MPALLSYVGGVRLLHSSSLVIPHEFRARPEYRGSVSIYNMTGNRVKILGAKSTCSCVSSTEFPVVIERWEKAHLDVFVERNPSDAPIHQRVEFYTDYPPTSRLVVLGFV